MAKCFENLILLEKYCKYKILQNGEVI